MTIKEFLAEQERLTEAATPGPWLIDSTRSEYEGHSFSEHGIKGVAPVREYSDSDMAHTALDTLEYADAEFIAAARSSVPRMLGALKAVMRVADMWEKAAAVHGPDDTVFLIDSYNAHIETIRGAIEAALGGEGDE